MKIEKLERGYCSGCGLHVADRVGIASHHLAPDGDDTYAICDDCLEQIVRCAGWEVEKGGEEKPKPVVDAADRYRGAEALAICRALMKAGVLKWSPSQGYLCSLEKPPPEPVIEWFGEPGHFCDAHDCVFHMHTHVNGKWCVSTVGEWYPGGRRRNDSQVKVGSDFYESMVFRVVGDGIDLSELEMAPYNDREAAQKGHMALVEKYKGMP